MFRLPTVLTFVLLTACVDDGARHLANARGLHRQLVSEGVRPESEKFNQVIAELDAIPESSKSKPAAISLKSAILAARVHLTRPLAQKHSRDNDMPPALLAQTQVCERLAEIIGKDGGASDAGLRALADCQLRIDRLEEQIHDSEQP